MSDPGTILVLSSSRSQGPLVKDTLTSRGLAVRQVESPYRLLAAFIAEPADVVVLDLKGLRLHDLELFTVLREIRPTVGIVALVDADQRELANGILSNGADLYLLKPAYGPELIEAIARAGMRRQLAEVKRSEPADLEALARFALGVAHEVNNPLTTISGWLQMLADDRASDAQLAGVLKSMKEESDRIADVIRQLLTFAQQAPPRREKVSPARVIADLVPLHAARCEPRDVKLTVSMDEALPELVGDPEQIRQAFDALFLQAESAAEQDGTITVTGKRRDGGLEVEFHDDGEPIPPEATSRIFDPFYVGRRTCGAPVGLGLAHGIIRSHGGSIEVSSDKASGTRFTVWLPAHEESQDTP